MNKLFKGAAALLAVIMLIHIPAFAEDTEAKPRSFTAEEAVKYMLSNSLTIKAQEEGITAYEMKRKADTALKKRVRDTYGRLGAPMGIDDMDTFLLVDGYLEYADEAQIALAKRTLSETKYQLTMQLENKFYSCLNSDRKVTVALEALDNAKENQRIADLKLEEGIIGAIEADSFGLAVISAENDYNDAVRSRDYMYAELKQLMSYPADSDIDLSGSFSRKEMNMLSLDAAISGIDKTANKLNLDVSLDLQEKLMNEYKGVYTSSMYEYQEQKYKYAQSQAEYEENVGKLRLAVINAYNTMRSTYDMLDYIDKAIELKEQQTDAQRTSYELGLSTATQYITAVQELDSLKLDLVDAEIGAYLSAKAYEMVYHAAE